MSQWWRAYNGSIDNPKLLKLSDAMHRAWYTLQCVASENNGVLPPAEDIAARLRVKPAKIAEWITKLVQARLIDNNDGIFVPHNWDTRQYKSDVTDPTAAKRQKRYRENKRNDRNATVTVERPEAEAKAESETEQSRADAGALVDEGSDRRIPGLKLQIEALFRAYKQTIPLLDRCAVWLAMGHQPSLVCQSVEKVLKRGKPVSTLDYFDGAIRDAHAAAPAPQLQVVSNKIWVDENTLEWNCWQRESNGGRGSPITDQRDSEGRLTGRRGWWFDTIVPAGYDEATGERLALRSAEDAA